MNKLIANSLFGYFESLYDLNWNIITLCGLDVEDFSAHHEKLLRNVIITIPQLVPYFFNKNDNKYTINPKDGLLDFSEDVPYLRADYDAILQHHYDLLESIKKVRNKFEHKMHGAQITGAGSVEGHVSFEITFTIGNEEIEISSDAIIPFIKDINNLFSKLQKDLFQYAKDNDKQFRAYYHRLLRFDFADFNKIYTSDILYIIGGSLLPF